MLTRDNHLTRLVLRSYAEDHGVVDPNINSILALLPTGVRMLNRKSRLVATWDDNVVNVVDALEPELRALDFAFEELGLRIRCLPDVKGAINEPADMS